jgi:hypothetical protein
MKRSLAMPFGVPSVPKASLAVASSLTSPRAVFGSMATEAAVVAEPVAKKARSQVADSAAAECSSDTDTASLGTPPAAVAPAGVPAVARADDDSAGAPPAPREAAKSVTFADVLETFAPEAPEAELPAPVAELRVASPEPAAAIDYSFFLQALEQAELAAQTLLENERGRAEAAAEAARGHEARAAELARALDAARADAAAASEAARLEAERFAGEHAAALAEARAQAERAQADAAALRTAIAGANSATLALQQAVAAAAAAVGEAAQLAPA